MKTALILIFLTFGAYADPNLYNERHNATVDGLMDQFPGIQQCKEFMDKAKEEFASANEECKRVEKEYDRASNSLNVAESEFFEIKNYWETVFKEKQPIRVDRWLENKMNKKSEEIAQILIEHLPEVQTYKENVEMAEEEYNKASEEYDKVYEKCESFKEKYNTVKEECDKMRQAVIDKL